MNAATTLRPTLAITPARDAATDAGMRVSDASSQPSERPHATLATLYSQNPSFAWTTSPRAQRAMSIGGRVQPGEVSRT